MKKWGAEEIKELRWRLGWSQAELARRLGCRQQTVSEWETGVYGPQNAYSKLLEMLTGHVDFYSNQVVAGTAAEVMLNEVGYAQISGDQIFQKNPRDFDPQID